VRVIQLPENRKEISMQPETPETVLHRPRHPRSILLLRIAALSAMLAVTTACINDSSGDESTSDSGSTDSGSTDSGSTDSGSTDSGSTDSGSTTTAVDITFSPSNQSSGIALSRTVSFEADTSLAPASVDSDSFILDGPNGPVSGTIDYSNGTAEFDPADELAPGTSYTITVTTDLQTADGDPIAKEHYANFTTVEASARPPLIDQWEQNMVEYGNQWGQALLNETDYLKKFKLRYYDAQRVHEQIAEYLGETQPWRGYGQSAEDNYKTYLENANFRAAGYQRFPHGLYLDWKNTGDSESKAYLDELRDRPSFSYPSGWEDEWAQQKYSREIAYSIQSQIIAERAGYPRQTQRLNTLVDLALGHIDIWVTKDYIDSDPDWQFCQAFMVGLTASALIEYYERSVDLGSPDSRVLPAIKRAGEFLWDEMWVPNADGSGYGAFEYVQPSTSGVGSESPAPDVSLLIAPMFSWLYLQTGNATWLQRGDDIFAGGVKLAWLERAKNFNQNYRSSFNFIEWRAEAVEKYGSR
jgi:hypothetical protein